MVIKIITNFPAGLDILREYNCLNLFLFFIALCYVCPLLFCRLSVGCNHLNYLDDCCDIDLFKPPEHKVVPCITIAVTDDSENANADWRRFFQAYNQLKDLTEW